MAKRQKSKPPKTSENKKGRGTKISTDLTQQAKKKWKGTRSGNPAAKKMQSDQHYRDMRACRCSIADFRSDGICYQHVFHYGLLQEVLQFGNIVDGYPQSTHKPSTNSIHKFRSMCFYTTFGFVDGYAQI